MSRRAMTMIELLLALALLSALTVASVSWTTATTRVLASEGGRASWCAAAERSLDLVGRTLATEDRGLEGRSRERWRVRIEVGAITIRARAAVTDADGDALLAGAIQLRAADGILRADYLDLDGRVALSRPLLGDVATLDVAVTELEDRSSRVTVRLVQRAGGLAERSWQFPRGEVR